MFKSFEPKTGSGGSNWRRACDRLHHQFQSPVEKSHLPLRTRLCQFGPSVWIFSILDDSDIHQMPMRTSSCPSQEVFHLLRPKERLWRLWPMEVQNAFSFFQRSWIFFFDLQFDMFRKFWRIWAVGKKSGFFPYLGPGRRWGPKVEEAEAEESEPERLQEHPNHPHIFSPTGIWDKIILFRTV